MRLYILISQGHFCTQQTSEWCLRHRPKVLETTALGAAWLAGSRAGIYPDQQGFAESWARDCRFEPQMTDLERTDLYTGWKDAVRRTLV